MTPKGVFRLLVLSATLLGLVAGVAGIAFEDRLPAPLRAWAQAEADREPTGGEVVLMLAAVAFLLAALVDTVGLLMFWRPARPLGVALAVAGVPLAAALGPSVAHGWEAAVVDFATLLWGAALAMAYCWPPVRARFDGRPPATQDAEPGAAADGGA